MSHPAAGGDTPINVLDSSNLLIADLETFGQSFARNEEIGEKRLSFFVTLASAAAGALAALRSTESQADLRSNGVVGAVLWGVFLLGLMTYFRMLHRNRVTDEYKDTLNHVRATYLALCPELNALGYRVPQPPSGKALWIRGGYVETVAVIQAMLAFGLAWFHRAPTFVAVVIGMAIGGTLMAPAIQRNRKSSLVRTAENTPSGHG